MNLQPAASSLQPKPFTSTEQLLWQASLAAEEYRDTIKSLWDSKRKPTEGELHILRAAGMTLLSAALELDCRNRGREAVQTHE